MRRILILAILTAFFWTDAQAKERTAADSEKAARGVIERTLGYFPKKMTVRVAGRLQDGSDYYSTEVCKGNLVITGSTPVAVCRGFYDYVRSNNYGVVTWSANTIELPDVFPDQAKKIVVSPFKHRYYMNVCTLGYTMPYWKWEDWQRELDWMALHGFDMPLSPIGSEAIFARVWRALGLTEEEIGDFVTGPAHFPWFRMGNMSRLDGQLPQNYYDQTIALEHRLIDRMNELGMSPIYNAFAGFVPEAVKRIAPDVELVKTGWGGGEYYVAHFIHPDTELYRKISTMYIEEWEKEFGKAKYYLADSFNEMDIPFAERGTQERFDQIASYGKNLYRSICDVNPDAVWVMQGWMFGFQRHIWDPESIRALFSEVPDDKMLLLDLSVDFNYGIWQNEYTWNYAPKIYGKQWIYSTVPNFGGRTCPIGDLDFYLNGHLRALGSPNKGNLMGYGTAPEGVENNEVIYEAISDAAWSGQHVDILEWLKGYTTSRYGKCPESIMTFWEKMLQTSYRFCSSRAQYRIQKQPLYRLGGRYDVSAKHFEALESFISAADELADNEAYKLDLALWAGIYAFGKADLLLVKIYDSYLEGDLAKAEAYEKEFRRAMLAADKFMDVVPQYRLQRWIDFARQWGATPE
ncbi:MAG: alpha-N-acetylglucosaminidase, partial [Alistipes sp.]|nr:alpha-N-acetylglucosaminidase [Alistipes sp.]